MDSVAPRPYLWILAALAAVTCSAAVPCALEFAPAEGLVKPPERPYRDELCLNGAWQFQPVRIPAGYRRNQGVAPALPAVRADGWEATPVKVPSPWNVNAWGGGRRETRPAERLYWPDSVYFPSYPAEWEKIEMGWLRREFPVPATWRDSRIFLHFEAVAGECRVVVNGYEVTHHFDSFLPFTVEVTAYVRRDVTNELLVGVRGPNLFNRSSGRYPKFLVTYPPGSMTADLAGIWQDVFLLAVPQVRVADTFVKPGVRAGQLELEVELANDTPRDQSVELSGEVSPWRNLAGADMLNAPVPNGQLGPAVLSVAPTRVTVKAGDKVKTVVRQPVQGRLRLWSAQSPQLYGLVLTLRTNGEILDRQYTRFGWRELHINGRDLLLNGEKLKMIGDFVHPFGAYMMSRRYVWAWYQMIKDVGGNAVRPHAQVHPRMYLDLADEMGLLLLAETSVFGSSIRLNPDEPVFWERYAAHYDGMVRRDRNHPSVMGWSFGNEMFAIPKLNQMNPEDTKAYYAKLAAIGRRSPALDPTRTWITCDGDEDLEGALPVWSKHFGHGDFVARLPLGLNKPLTVGESGGTYYATPEQLSVFNGDRAFEDYLGRNEALAIDLYANLVRLALPRLAYFSPSLLVWYGLEHLNLGYRDFSRLPGLQDGVLFTRPFEDGKPGMQIERLPPYTTTLNPGYDPALPMYKPLPMFHAMKAALAPGGPQPCPWDHRREPAGGDPPRAKTLSPSREPPAAAGVALIGRGGSVLAQRLRQIGVPLADELKPDYWAILDGHAITEHDAPRVRRTIDDTLARGGTVLVMLADANVSAAALNASLPLGLIVTNRMATMLQPNRAEPWAAGLGMKDLYFANAPADRRIQKCGLAGALVSKGHVVLEAGRTDWSLFNHVPEKAKAGAVVMYEHLQKPAGAALVRVPFGPGILAVCSIDYRIDTPAATALWRTLFGNMGLKLQPPQLNDGSRRAKPKVHDLLLNGPMN